MPVVNIKGVGQAQFPDGMSVEDIRSFLRKKYAQDMGATDVLAPIPTTAQPYEPTLPERMGQGLSDALFDSGVISDRYGAQQVGSTLSSIGEMLPVIGDAAAGDEFGRAVAQDDYSGMALAGIGAIPVVGKAAKSAIKGITKLDSVSFHGMDNKKLAIQTVKENRDNIALNIDDPEILERIGIYEANTGKKPILQFTNALGTTFVNADGSVARVSSKGEFVEKFENEARSFMENRALKGNKKRIESQQTPEQIEAEKVEFKRRKDEEIKQYRTQQEDSYKMQHTAPMRDDNPSGNDVNDSFPGIYSGHANDYLTGVAYDNKALRILQGMKGKPDKAVTIYRAVPKGVKEIHASDWVTTTKEYAQDHMEGEQGWHILSKKVKAKDIATDGNSIHEFGYDPVKSSIPAVGNLTKNTDFNAIKKLPYREKAKLASEWQTGQPIKLSFARNKESSKNYPAGMDFGQKLEPSGRYMNVEFDSNSLGSGTPGWEYGEIEFSNPIVLEHKSTNSTGWKKDLSEMFGGSTGKRLTTKIKKAGHDGIITRDADGFNETISLK